MHSPGVTVGPSVVLYRLNGRAVLADHHSTALTLRRTLSGQDMQTNQLETMEIRVYGREPQLPTYSGSESRGLREG